MLDFPVQPVEILEIMSSSLSLRLGSQMETVTADALIQVDEILRNQGRLILWATVIIAFLMLFVLPNPTHRSSAKVPTIKFVSMLLPEFLSRLLFNSSAATVIYKGYQQVSNQILSHLTIEGVLKADGDLIVLSTKYAEELRQLPSSTLNALEATFSVRPSLPDS
jgi:hypothetical protein